MFSETAETYAQIFDLELERVQAVIEDDDDAMDAPADWDMGAIAFDPWVD
jgi:hypothetical protein